MTDVWGTAMTETKPKRRWFTFSLRTLFVLVTVLCVWLGYQVNWIWQRREFVRKLCVDSGNFEAGSARTETLQGHDSPTISWIRRAFGDQAYSILILPEKYTPDLIERANDLFPEALVHRWADESLLAEVGSGTLRLMLPTIPRSDFATITNHRLWEPTSHPFPTKVFQSKTIAKFQFAMNPLRGRCS